uniref:BEN domain-containing protein n=1 Tax=Knipowitschia caucasica TaxID=637954 RepID=A0AAV2MD90_KNICA
MAGKHQPAALQESDETDIDTDIDLFDHSQRWTRKKRKAILESDDETEESSQTIVDGAGVSPSILAQSGTNNYTVLDQSTANAIKELPSLLLQIKNTLAAITYNSTSTPCPSVSSDDGHIVTQTQMIALGGSDVQVEKKLYDRLNTSRVSLFVQDLASLVFGKECLGRSTLTGKGGKEQLDSHKVNVIADTVRERFPGTSVSEIRSLLRRKCNNESYYTKKTLGNARALLGEVALHPFLYGS